MLALVIAALGHDAGHFHALGVTLSPSSRSGVCGIFDFENGLSSLSVVDVIASGAPRAGRRGAGASRIHAGREEGTRTGHPDRDAEKELLDGDESAAKSRASAAAAAAEDGEDGDDSDEEDAEDEEGAKTEGRRGARGDGGEKYTEKGDEEKQGGKKDGDEKGASKATAVETGFLKKSEREEEETTEGESSSSGSGSDDATAASSDSDADADSPTPRFSRKKKEKASAAGTRRGSALLESLEEIVDSVSVDRAGRACELRLSLALDAPRLLMLETAERVAALEEMFQPEEACR